MMDVTRGDRVLWYGAEYEVVDAPSRTGVVPLRTVANGHYVVAVVNSLSPVPPEVVTPPDFSFAEAVEYRTSAGALLPGRWVGVDPVNERMGIIRNNSGRGGNVVTVSLDDIRRPLPEVVTLTLSYRGHEVSEEISVEAWREWTEWRGHEGGMARACRALAEKVDGEDQ